MERKPARSSPEQPIFTHEKLWVGIRRLLREKTELRALAIPSEKASKSIKREHEELFDADHEDMCSVIENIYGKSVKELFAQKHISVHEHPSMDAPWEKLGFSEKTLEEVFSAYPKVWTRVFKTITIRPHITIPGHGREFQQAMEVVHHGQEKSLSIDTQRLSTESSLKESLGYDVPLLLSYATARDREQLLPLEDRLRHRFLKTAVLLDRAWNSHSQARFNPDQLWKQGDQYEAELIALAVNSQANTPAAWEQAFQQELEEVYGYTPQRAMFHRAVLEELWKSHTDIPVAKTIPLIQKSIKEVTEERRHSRTEVMRKQLPQRDWEELFEGLEYLPGLISALKSQEFLRERQLNPTLLRLCIAWVEEMSPQGTGNEGRVQHALEDWKRRWMNLEAKEKKQELNAMTHFLRFVSAASIH